MDRNKLKFSKTILCLIEVNKCYNQDYAHRNAEFGDVSRRLDLYEDLMAIINPRRKKIIDACEFYLTNLTDSNGINKIVRDSYDLLVETIGYIIENNLESTLEDAGYGEADEFECRNDSVVLNDEHYECAKSELVNRNFEILKIIIEDGGDVNSYDSLILKTAYRAADIGWIDYFIGKGAKFKGRSDGFEEACKSDKVEVLEHWIKNGGVVPKNPQYQCINMACLLGNFNMVKLLVENGVDLGDPKTNGARIAFRLGFRRTLKYLLDNNAVVGNICRYQLERACLVDDIELVKMILEHYDRLGVLERKDKTNTKNEEAQDISCFDSGNTDLSEEYKITKTLLEKGKPIQNSDLLDVIRLVAIANSTESLELLLAYKFNFNDIYKILKISVQLGNLEAVKVFLRNDFNVNGDTVILKTALVSKKDKMAGLLLQHGAKVGRDIYCYQEYLNLDDIETLQLMLTCCPEIGGNSSLLQYAIEKNKIETVKLLLKDTITFEDSEYNYILWACEINDLEILKFLLAKGANIREGGESGVIEACKNNNLEMLKLLLERNPNLVLEKVYGLETAIELENMEMVNLLIKYGADTSEYIESILELADELDCDDLSESCECNAGGFKKVKRT
ncbi:putative ankyrin repeat protein L63 [Zancudomyces culisetae]|uniref:Putative ankyrin repeat protein L63 n=1 Tax=Zancudomyces culisetae TaxID=1213189 RepID=A0A1R1PTH7_ZANCU|nr:putative ankyrin repeat protein L63 [Zancudomyces culisetae]|eukprot:OMH84192.1 putative ankyrin repeat protein L63 [Zancudomyces culisetae]